MTIVPQDAYIFYNHHNMRYIPAEPNNYQPVSLTRRLFGILLVVLSLLLFYRYYDYQPQPSKPVAVTASSAIDQSPPPSEPPVVVKVPEPKWQILQVQKGDSLARLFKRVGLSERDLHEVMTSSKLTTPLKHLKIGQEVRFDIDDNSKQLNYMEVPLNAVDTLRVSHREGAYQVELLQKPLEEEIFYKSISINGALSIAAQKAEIPNKVTHQLIDAFGWELDFSHDIRKGAKAILAYQAYTYQGKPIRYGDLLAASLQNAGKTYHAIRYRDQQKQYQYYTPSGKNLRKGLLRRPVKNAYISSPFNLHRHHPILGVVRPHTGTDFAAPYGTPIRATGDGRISFLGNKGGYGRVIIIQHGNHYSTLYAHMSRYGRGLKKGSWVKQSQVIGYIGTSGLATGPHIHYEVRINNQPHDPIKVKLPQALPLARSRMVDFTPYAENLLNKLQQFENLGQVSHD